MVVSHCGCSHCHWDERSPFAASYQHLRCCERYQHCDCYRVGHSVQLPMLLRQPFGLLTPTQPMLRQMPRWRVETWTRQTWTWRLWVMVQGGDHQKPAERAWLNARALTIATMRTLFEEDRRNTLAWRKEP